MELSIVIVNWKVKDLLWNCLDSIFAQKGPGYFEVIVVDNRSDDGSVEMIRREFPQVKLIRNESNVGFARACNQGIRVAEGRFIFILNPDTLVKSNTLRNIINFMESNPKVAIGGCYIYYPDGRIQTSFYRFTRLKNLLGRTLLLYSFLPKTRFTAPLFVDCLDSSKSVERVCGGAMVVRREAFEEVGLFDESFFLYYEDEDLCFRMKQKGWMVTSIPNTKIVHHHSQSAKKNEAQAIFSSYRSQFIFYKKFHPLHKVLVFRVVQMVGVSIRSLFWFLASVTCRDGEAAKQKFFGYLSVFLSNFNYTRTLIKQTPCE